MFDVGELKLADILNIAVSNLGGGIGLVLVEDALSVPLLNHASDGHNTASAMLSCLLVC